MENPKGSGRKKVAPKQSTIAEEMTLFRAVWNWGISEGFIRASLKKHLMDITSLRMKM